MEFVGPLCVSVFVGACLWTCFVRFRRRPRISRFDEYLEQYRLIVARGDPTGRYGNETIVVDPALIGRIASSVEDRGRPSYASDDKLTHSLFNANGEPWRSTRRLLDGTVFATGRLRRFAGGLVECADWTVAAALGTGSPGERGVVDAVPLARDYVHAVVYRCVYGRRELPPDAEFAAASKALRHADTSRFWLYSACRRPRWTRRMDGGVAGYFARLTAPRAIGDIRPDSFLHMFLSLARRNDRPDAEDWDSVVQGNCAAFLLGGFTSTSATVAFALFELAANPAVQRRLYGEISALLGPGTFAETANDPLREFVYLQRVVDETLRKYPPFAANARVCSRDFDDGRTRLTKGQRVVVPVSGIHRDERYHARPDAFDPDRPSRRRHEYMPFGLGRRTCVGKRFALLAIKVFLIRVIAEYRVEPPAYGEFALPPFAPDKFTTAVDRLPLRLVRR